MYSLAYTFAAQLKSIVVTDLSSPYFSYLKLICDVVWRLNMVRSYAKLFINHCIVFIID